MTFSTVSIKQLKPSQYKSFSCGESALDEYLKRFAKTNEKKGLGRTFALLGQKCSEVIGYYTLGATEIDFNEMPEAHRTGLPRYPIPAARLCRLAISSNSQGMGLGELLLMDAIDRIMNAANSIAIHMILVDAKHEKAKKFYLKYQFMTMSPTSLKLFLPLNTLSPLEGG